MSTEDEIKQLKDRVRQLEGLLIAVGGNTTMLIEKITDDGKDEARKGLTDLLLSIGDELMMKSLKKLITDFK